MNNRVSQMSAGLFLFSEGTEGNPLYLILGIAFLVGGVWYALREKKKSKEQREYERKQLSKRFLDNVNRNQDAMSDQREPGSEIFEEAKPTQKQTTKRGKKE